MIIKSKNRRKMKQVTRKNLGLLIMLIALSISNFINAQPPGGPGGHGDSHQGPPPIPTEKQIEKMVSELADYISLNEEVESIVLDLYIGFFETMENKMEAGRPNRDEMEALKEDFESDIKALLSDEQQDKFDSFQKNHHPNNKERK